MTTRMLLALQPDSPPDTLVSKASTWASRLGLTLDLCSVIPVIGGGVTELTAQGLQRALRQEHQETREWLEAQIAHVPEAVRGEVHIWVGDPQAEIIDKAVGYRMLLVGTHHRRDLARLLLGSVAESLVRTAPVPVLVLATEPMEPHDPLRVQLPFDPHEPNYHAIEWARAHLPDARLTAVHMLPWAEHPETAVGDAFAEAEERLATALEAAGYGDVEGVVLVRRQTNVAEALATEAAAEGVDLIAMPTHGRTGFARLLMGSVSERVVRAAGCAVLVVR